MRNYQSFQVGERVIYRMSKWSVHPSPRAMQVRPEPAGEGYQYEVKKFMTVREVRGTQVVLLTRRGKIRIVDVSDPALQRAGWWERLIYRDRFPSASNIASASSTVSA